MSLLDELAQGMIDLDHDCRVPTQYGRKSRMESHLFTNKPIGTTWECICGRVFVVVCPHGHKIWKVR